MNPSLPVLLALLQSVTPPAPAQGTAAWYAQEADRTQRHLAYLKVQHSVSGTPHEAAYLYRCVYEADRTWRYYDASFAAVLPGGRIVRVQGFWCVWYDQQTAEQARDLALEMLSDLKWDESWGPPPVEGTDHPHMPRGWRPPER